jgi:predicted  nucleic acid-binding Zn-ribbon protein
VAKPRSRKQRIRHLEREVGELRFELDRLTTLHLEQSVRLVHLEDQVSALRAEQDRAADRPQIDTALAQLVANLADVRRRLPA